ncbi:hypothetical protein BJ165DRAFT_1514525 [Panaeolus papilionaceus]|nr:hypothetical protein BJ165DRAFT_1514525 [Panaeolus papilionaceus]
MIFPSVAALVLHVQSILRVRSSLSLQRSRPFVSCRNLVNCLLASCPPDFLSIFDTVALRSPASVHDWVVELHISVISPQKALVFTSSSGFHGAYAPIKRCVLPDRPRIMSIAITLPLNDSCLSSSL